MIPLLGKQFSVRGQLLLLLLVIPCRGLWGQTEDSRGISLGVDSIHTTEDVCLMLGAKAVAKDFFKGLETRTTSEGRTFKRHGRVVKSFPAQLTVKIEAAVGPCVGKGVPDCDRCSFRFDGAFMNSLQFNAYWKHGFDMQKAEIGVLSVEQSDDLAEIAPSADLWKYEFSVNSKDVALTESLVVVVHAPDGRIVSRLSGKP